jgi:hypothetical protein
MRSCLVLGAFLISSCLGPGLTVSTHTGSFGSVEIPIRQGEQTQGEIRVPDVTSVGTVWHLQFPEGAVGTVSGTTSNGAKVFYNIIVEDCTDTEGYLDCVIRWPILEAQSGGTWTLTVTGLADGDLLVDVSEED